MRKMNSGNYNFGHQFYGRVTSKYILQEQNRTTLKGRGETVKSITAASVTTSRFECSGLRTIYPRRGMPAWNSKVHEVTHYYFTPVLLSWTLKTTLGVTSAPTVVVNPDATEAICNCSLSPALLLRIQSR